MTINLTVGMENKPGTLADLGEALGKAGVNIEGICGFASEGRAVAQILVNDSALSRRALESAGIHVDSERAVIIVDLKDEPGEFGKMCRKMADAGVNIELVYLATRTRLVLGSDNLVKARQLLE